MTGNTVQTTSESLGIALGPWQWLSVAAVPVAIMALLPALGLPHDRFAVAAVSLVCLWYWASGCIPDFLASLLFFFLMASCTASGADVIFSGFAASAFWLAFGGAVFSMALKATGLGSRVASVIATRFGASYPKAVCAFVALGFLLSLAMPSTLGRVAILMPVVLGFCDTVGLAPGRTGRRGLVLAATLSTYELSSAVLPANLPNLVMTGAAERAIGTGFSYIDYLVLLAPALVLVRAVLLVAVALWLFPDRLEDDAPAREREARIGITPKEWRLVLVLSVTLLAWTTDSIHGIAPGWIAIGAAILCLGPAHLVGTEDFLRGIKIEPLWFIAAVIGFTAALDKSGLASEIVHRIDLSAISGAPAFVRYLTLCGLSIALTFAVTSNAVPAIYTPLVAQAVGSTGFTGVQAMLVQVLGFSTVFLPYQAPPVVLGMALGSVSRRDATRYCLAVALASLPSVLPVNYLWWQAVGFLGG